MQLKCAVIGWTAPLFLFAACTVERPSPQLVNQDVRLTFIHTSDIHSRLFPYHFVPGKIDEDYGLKKNEGPYGGIARIGAIVREERKRSGRSLWLDSGDCFQGAPIFNQYHGEVEFRALSLLGLDGAVRFLGPQPQDVLPLYYAAADATVLPSRYESFGMVALEAMACGSPVIASRVGGLTTTVRDGVTGFLVREGNVAALADRIDRLLGDPDLAWRLGREGVRWAARHRWPCVAEAVCREYARLAVGAEPHLAAARCRD